MQTFSSLQLADAGQVAIVRQFVDNGVVRDGDVRRLSPSEVESRNRFSVALGWHFPPLPVGVMERRAMRREFVVNLPSGSCLSFDRPRDAVRCARRHGLVPVVRIASGRVRVLRVPA